MSHPWRCSGILFYCYHMGFSIIGFNCVCVGGSLVGSVGCLVFVVAYLSEMESPLVAMLVL